MPEKQGFFDTLKGYYERFFDFWDHDIGEDGKSFGQRFAEAKEKYLSPSRSGFFGGFLDFPIKIYELFRLLPSLIKQGCHCIYSAFSNGTPFQPELITDSMKLEKGQVQEFDLKMRDNNLVHMKFFEGQEGNDFEGHAPQPEGYYIVDETGNKIQEEPWPSQSFGRIFNKAGMNVTPVSDGKKKMSISSLRLNNKGESVSLGEDNLAADILLAISEGEVMSIKKGNVVYNRRDDQTWKNEEGTELSLTEQQKETIQKRFTGKEIE